MEKAVVSVTLQRVHLRGPVGKPLLVCFLASEGRERQLVSVQYTQGGLWEVSRRGWPAGQLTASVADAMTNMVGDLVYNSLLTHEGIQGELEDLV